MKLKAVLEVSIVIQEDESVEEANSRVIEKLIEVVDEWINENDELYNVLIMNITNTYLTIIQENEFKLLGEDDDHINHIMRIEKTAKYRKDLKKLLKEHINNI